MKRAFASWLASIYRDQEYRDQEKEFPRGVLLCPLSLVHSALNARSFLTEFNEE
jgi:hypothetical protein